MFCPTQLLYEPANASDIICLFDDNWVQITAYLNASRHFPARIFNILYSKKLQLTTGALPEYGLCEITKKSLTRIFPRK